MVLVLKKKHAQTPRHRVEELLKNKAKEKNKHLWNKFFWQSAVVA